jgi:hypothetical protein
MFREVIIAACGDEEDLLRARIIILFCLGAVQTKQKIIRALIPPFLVAKSPFSIDFFSRKILKK